MVGGPVAAGEGAKPTRRLAISTGEAIQGLGGLAVLLLGSIYALGALLTMADLRGAGASIRDALQLVPLEQLLARGIGTALGVFAALVGMAAFAALWNAWQTAAQTPTPRADRLTTDDPPRALVLFGLAWSLISLGIFLAGSVMPFLIGLGVLVAVAVFVLLANTDLTTHRQDIAIGLTFILVGLAAHTYFAPQPLADARLDVDEGPDVTGALVSVADGRWHLVSDKAQIVVVPDDSVLDAVVTAAGSHRLQQPVWSLLHLPILLLAGVALLSAAYGVRFLVVGVRNTRASDRSPDGSTPI